MKNKKGISLIVLVITIIIMIILASAIIITLSNSNIINRADEAVSKTSLSQIQELASIAWTEAYADGKKAGKVLNATELHDAVIKSLKANGLKDKDLENYTILTTDKGVTVKIAVPTLVIDQKLGASAAGAEVVDGSPFTLSGTVTDNKGIKSLTVNGVEVTVGNDGKWSTTLTVSGGETLEIIVEATNNKDNSTTIKGYVTTINYVDITVSNFPDLAEIDCYLDDNGALNIPGTYYNEEEDVWYRVTAIGGFEYAPEIQSITIPDTITTILENAFVMMGVPTVYYTGTLEQWLKINFISSPRPADLYIKGELLEGEVRIPETISYVQGLKGVKNITSIILPDTVTGMEVRCIL